jgi:hypothetical protein
VVTRKQIAVLWASALIPSLGCSKGPDMTKPQSPVTPVVEAEKKAPSLIALTSAATGEIFLVDRESLELVAPSNRRRRLLRTQESNPTEGGSTVQLVTSVPKVS